MDSRRPVYDLAFISMMFLQLALAGLIAWKLVSVPQVAGESELQQKVAELQSALDQKNASEKSAVREQAYSDILDRLVTKETGKTGIVDELVGLRDERRMLVANLEGQFARVRQADGQRAEMSRLLDAESAKNSSLVSKLESSSKDFNELKANYNELLDKQIAAGGSDPTKKSIWWWLPYAGGGLLVLVIAVGGYWMGWTRSQHEEEYNPAESSPSRNEPTMNIQSNFGEQVSGEDHSPDSGAANPADDASVSFKD